MIEELSSDALDTYLKILILLYADDTVLMSETAERMQQMLNTFNEYCKIWKLHVNADKTKVIIFFQKKGYTKF